MVDLLFAVNATAPIILMVAVGYFLKRIGLINADLAKAMNKLVYRAFLPAMLFLNMYKIESFSDIDFSFVW
jgi:predicted permease